MKKTFVPLTLAVNRRPVILPVDNIAFALEMEQETEEERLLFTRVYLKQVMIDDDCKWVDVSEPPDKIASLAR